MDKEDPKLYLNQLVMVEYTFQHPTNLAVVKQALPGTSYHIGGSEFQDSEWVQCCLFSVLFIREFVMSILQQCYLDDLMFQFGYHVSKWSCSTNMALSIIMEMVIICFNICGGVVKLTMRTYIPEKTRGLSIQRFFPGRGVVSRIAGSLVDYHQPLPIVHNYLSSIALQGASYSSYAQ